MSIVYIKKISENGLLGLWQITESVENLLENLNLSVYDKQIFEAKINDRKKKEWLACRNLVATMLKGPAGINYDLNGKPYFSDNTFQISMSHSAGYACVYINKFNTVGVDIQQLKTIPAKGVQFFLNEEENGWIASDDNVMLPIIWSVKETVFKYCGIYELDIKKDILLSPFTSNQNGIIEVNVLRQIRNHKILVHYEILDDYVLTYTI